MDTAGPVPSREQAQLPVPDFRTLFDAIPGSHCLLLPDEPVFTVVAVTDDFVRDFKVERADVIGRSLLQILPPDPGIQTSDGKHALSASLRRVLDSERADQMPTALNKPIFGSNGRVDYLLHTLTDVTGSIVPDAQLREGQERFTLAFEEAPVGMVLTTPEGRMVEINQAFLDMLGYTREEVISGDSAPLTHPDDILPTRKFFESLQHNPRATLEKRYRRKDGEYLWARVSARMRRDAEGQPAQLVGIIENIADRKRAGELLQESQARLSAIYDGTYEYIGLLAPDGTLLEANRASLEFAGNTREDVINRPFWETPWFTATPGASESVRQGVARAAAGEFVRYELGLRRPSGEITTFDFSLHPVRDESGKVVLIVPEGRDITEHRAAELRDAFLVQLDDATRPLTDPGEITSTAARLLGEHLRVNRCACADVDDDEDTFNVTSGFAFEAASIVGRYRFTQFGAECRRLMRLGQSFVVTDSDADLRTQNVLTSYRAASIRALICVPLLKAGRLVASMAVQQITPRRWKWSEVELVQQVASRCWESLERARVARALKESEQRLRLSQRAGRIGSFEWLIKEDRVIWTPELEALYGVPEHTFEGDLNGWRKRIVPEDAERVMAELANCVAQGETDFDYEFRAVLPDGKLRWLRGQAQIFLDKSGAPERMVGVNIDIDAHRKAEAHLHRQWHTFDTALSNTPDFTYTFDLEGRFTYVNRSLLSMLQVSLEDMLGKNLFDLSYPPELADRVHKQILQVIDTKEPLRDQTPFTSPGGETRHYEYIFVPVLAEDGSVQAVAGSTRDITDRNRATELVRTDRERWRALLLQTPAAIAILRGPDHTYEWVNTAYRELVGRTAESLIGKQVLSSVPEAEGLNYLELLDRVYRTGEAFHGHEVRLRINTGETGLKDVYLNFVYLATRDLAGEIDGIFVHATDVTDMVLARKHVEESEQQFRTLAETIPHLAWMADETGSIFWYNHRWYDYTGTSFEEMKGWGWKKVHDPAILPEVLAQWQVALTSGEPFEMVFPLRSAEGAYRAFLTRVEPVRDSRGRVVRWFGTNTDITEQQQTEEELRRTNRELEEFAFVASHDLQEPLRMVNIYTRLILKRLETPDPEMAQYAAFVAGGVGRMEALIHDLLTFSRTVQNDDVPVATAELSDSLNEALALLDDRIRESGAVVRADSLPVVRGDGAQIAHVFQNLLSNALKYRKPDVPPDIHISVSVEGPECVVAVRDNGIGFDQKYADRIFGLFKRLHKDEYPGTGLGLAICKRIVERYGGKIRAESRPGEGATFYFSLLRPA